MQLPIYLDNNATTPVDERVIAAMMPFFTDKFGNVASRHCFGRAVKGACDQAREQVAALLGASAGDIIFTSGATESINLAIKGIAEGCAADGRHIITSKIEHKAVLDSCAALEQKGFAVTYLDVDAYGMLSPESVQSAIRKGALGTLDRTILVSFMAANNEIGTINPTQKIIDIARAAGVRVHVDAAQAAGKIPCRAAEWGADLVSVSAHKIYGPKGVGALYVRRESPQVKICAQIHGGGQECGLRSGTLAVPLVVGLGTACALAQDSLEDEMHELAELRHRLWTGIQQAVPEARLNGHPVHRLPGNLHVTFPNIDGELLSVGMRDIAVSSSSACSSDAAKPSYVLKAIGRTDDEAFSSIRFGIGRFNTAAEIDFALGKITATAKRFGKKKVSSRPEALGRI